MSSDIISPEGIELKILDYFKTVATVGVPAHNETGSYCSQTTPTVVDTYYSTTDTEKKEGKTYFIYTQNKEREWGYFELTTDVKEARDSGVQIFEQGEKVIEFEIKITNSMPRKEITAGYPAIYDSKSSTARPGIFITLPKCWIKEIQLYQRVEGLNGRVIHLGDLDSQSVGKTYYKYFFPNDAYKKEEVIKYIYYGLKNKLNLSSITESRILAMFFMKKLEVLLRRIQTVSIFFKILLKLFNVGYASKSSIIKILERLSTKMECLKRQFISKRKLAKILVMVSFMELT